jgi:hypothetical protein
MLSSELLVSVLGLYGEKARKKSLLKFNIIIISIQPNKKSNLFKFTMVILISKLSLHSKGLLLCLYVVACIIQ